MPCFCYHPRSTCRFPQINNSFFALLFSVLLMLFLLFCRFFFLHFFTFSEWNEEEKRNVFLYGWYIHNDSAMLQKKNHLRMYFCHENVCAFLWFCVLYSVRLCCFLYFLCLPNRTESSIVWKAYRNIFYVFLCCYWRWMMLWNGRKKLVWLIWYFLLCCCCCGMVWCAEETRNEENLFF